jgi:hypothetical protein
MPTEYVIGDTFAQEWNRIRDKIDGVAGDGVANSPTSVSHGQAGPPTPSKGGQVIYIAKITGTPDGSSTSGRYKASIIYGVNNNDPGNLTLTDLGQVSTQDIEVWNMAEIVSGSSSLATGDPVPVVLFGYNKTAGMPIYMCISAPGGTPTGTVQGQVYQMVTDLQPQFGLPFMVSMDS